MQGLLQAAPCLAIVQVGDNPASSTYVRLKMKAAHTCGIVTKLSKVDAESCTLKALLEMTKALNADPGVNGILIQLPLPARLGPDAERVLTEAVSVEKDVDGLRAANIGKLALHGHTPLFCPCTPQGCLEMLF